ncbi:hypothetical protein VKS41_008797 [Umbelopsis sp. WA50703]
MERMTNHEYDLQYRRHMDKLQRQAQYISDLMRYASIQDEAHTPHGQYHSGHSSVPLPPRQHSYYPQEIEKKGPYVPAKPQQKPLKSILRRTTSSNVPEMPVPSPTPPLQRKQPVSLHQPSTSPLLDNVGAGELRRVRIQGSHHTSYYTKNGLPEDEDEDSAEEVYYDRGYRANRVHRYESDSEEDHEGNETYSDEDDESFESPRQFDETRRIYQRQPIPRQTYPSPGNHIPRNQMAMARDHTKYFQNTSNMDSYLDSTIHQMGLHNANPDSYQVPHNMSTQNPSVTSILESFFETPAPPLAPNSTMSSPLSSQDDSSQNLSSPRPSYSSSTSFTNSTNSKGFLSSLFRKSPAPIATSPNIITTRPMAHRPNAKRHELLNERDVAEIRELTRTQQFDAALDPAVAAKDAVVKVAALSQVWCFRMFSQQPDDESDPPVWTAFDYKHQAKLSKYAASNKEYMFRDSHLQGDVLILPAKGSGHVRGKTQARLEVKQLDIDPDTTFVYREGVKAKKWM